MKKYAIMFGVFLIVMTLVNPGVEGAFSSAKDGMENKTKKSPITLYLGGAYSFIDGGDLNSVIFGKKKSYSDANDYFAWNEFKNVYDINFEVIYNISKIFGLGIGVGYITNKSQGEYGWEQDDGDSNSYTREYKINSWVISGNIHLNIPLSKIFTLDLTGGGDYYLGKLNHQNNRNWDYWYNRTVWYYYYGFPLFYYTVRTHTQGNYVLSEDMTCNTFGFHGGIGLDTKISSNLSIVVHGLYRYIKINNCFGSYEYKSGSGSTAYREGFFWFFEGDYPEMSIQEYEDPPSNVRKAVLNLSGFSIRVGFKVRF